MVRSAIVATALVCAPLWGAFPSATLAQGTSSQGTTQDSTGHASTGQGATKPSSAQAHAAAKKKAPAVTRSGAAPYHPSRFSRRAELHYGLVWGVDSLAVRWAESGELIRFSYRVLDPAKAAPLNDKRSEPSLIDPRAGVQLVVPSMENIGKLRQSTPAEEGKSYWIAFSNKGRRVKRGDHVSVVIGQFRADGLVVD